MNEEMAMQYQRGYIDGFKEGKATFEPKEKAEKMSYSERTVEDVVGIIRKMPYQFTMDELDKFIFLLNERLDEIIELHKEKVRNKYV